LELINTNNEAIQFVSIELLLPRPHGQKEPPLSTTLTYGQEPSSPIKSSSESKPINPGQSVVLTLSDNQHANLRALLHSLKYDERIDRIRLSLEEVLFVNGTKWIAGQFFRRDDLDPDRWVPLEDSIPSFRP
jgi:hypothetical protein